MKLDNKTLVMIFFILFGVIFFGLWFFKGNDSKNKIKDLENEVIRIESIRDSIKEVNTKLSIDFDRIQSEINTKESKIKEVENSLVIIKNELNISNNKVKTYQKDLLETKRKIDLLTKNPPNREGDDLINSLMEKLK